MNGVLVNNVLKFLKDKPSNDDHAILIQDKKHGLTRIPLSLRGIVSYFPTRKPTISEYEQCDLHLELTSEGPEWDPGSTIFEQQESLLLDSRGQLQDTLQQQFDQEKQASRRITQL